MRCDCSSNQTYANALNKFTFLKECASLNMEDDEISFFLQYIELSSAAVSAFSMLDNKHSNRRGPTLYQRYRSNDPVECLCQGMDGVEFKRLFRMSPESFHRLYNILASGYVLQHRGRPSIPFSSKLGLYLYFVGHITDYVACGNFFGIAGTTAFKIVQEMVDLIMKFKSTYIAFPSTPEQYNELKVGMAAFTALEGAIAAVDGCHIPILLPPNADSRSFYCFKGFYSSLIIVVCDYKYRILGYSLGHTGCKADSSIVVFIYLDKS